MDPSALYFTFLNGAFRYDCVACGQQCCRGKGIALDSRRELLPLLSRAPAIAPFVDQLPGGYVKLPDVTDGCWFLRADGRCGYEVQYGRDAKFTTCRLFPFNRVFAVGQKQKLRVVDFNSVVCPLIDAHGSGGGVTHTELREELVALGEGPLTSSEAPLPPGAESLRWLALEEAVREQSAGYLNVADYTGFSAWQEVAAQRHFGEKTDMDEVIAAHHALLATWREFYGITQQDLAPHGGVVARRLALLTPSLRFNALFRRGAPPYGEEALRLPRQLLGAWLLSTLAARVGDQAPSLRGLTELHQAQRPQRELLARFGDPVRLLALPAMPDAPPALQQALAGVVHPKGTARPLWELLARAAGPVPPAQRPLLLSLLLRAGPSLQFTG